MTPTERPYGSWPSPIMPDLIATHEVRLSLPRLVGGSLYWRETRAAESGRGVVWRRTPDGTVESVTPDGVRVKSRCHEYGGGDYCVIDGVPFVVEDTDQRVYRLDAGAAVPITPAPPSPRADRFADLVPVDGASLVAVCETHRTRDGAPDVRNALVEVPADGGEPPRVLWAENDFVAAPAVSPSGGAIAWIVWDHPYMPWDASELWVAERTGRGTLRGARRVAGGTGESILQPSWITDDTLVFVSDRTGYWNLHRLTLDRGEIEPIAPRAADHGYPPWVFGLSQLAFVGEGRIAAVRYDVDRERIVVIDPDGATEDLDLPYTNFGYGPTLTSDGGGRLAFVGAAPDRPPTVVLLDLREREIIEVRRGLSVSIDAGYVSVPEAVEFPTDGGQSAYAWFYRPTNRDAIGPADEKPPLIVLSHGGPTARASSGFDLGVQFWTSRGFAVIDVNYGGSVGYGRAYRERLTGRWGTVDTADCVNAALDMVRRGLVDGARLVIKGGSAGGFTTLSALVSSDVFAAGASAYGVADLERLARDTHKFESRYLESLVGPYPETRDRYVARSPVHRAGEIRCPVILLQGLEDRVVPPEQSETIVAALAESGLPHAYVTFDDEGHGFERGPNIRRALAAQLTFFGRVLGFEPADGFEPLEIHNR